MSCHRLPLHLLAGVLALAGLFEGSAWSPSRTSP